jgi:hypothetical protein
MAKRKYPSELNTRTVRVNIGDWHLLMELARQHDTTVAKVLHLAITDQARQEQVTRISPAQIPMAAFRVAPVTSIAVNGNKQVAFKIKPRGGVIYE